MSNISLIAKHSKVFPFNLLVVIYYQELNPAIHSYFTPSLFAKSYYTPIKLR
jgi:hypothetical protein